MGKAKGPFLDHAPKFRRRPAHERAAAITAEAQQRPNGIVKPVLAMKTAKRADQRPWWVRD